MSGILILGSGLAGYSLAKEIRKLDKSVALTIVTGDDGAAYSKPMLSNALAKAMPVDDLVTANAAALVNQLNATIHTHRTVLRIDPQHSEVITEQGPLPYSALVLAVGAKQLPPGIQGSNNFPIYSVNDLGDYRRFRDALQGVQQVAIVGTGLIGCEFANDLLSAAMVPTIIGPGQVPLPRLLPLALAEEYQARLTEAGVRWVLGSKAVRLQAEKGKAVIQLENGATVETQLVLSAVGLQPRTDLAHAAGIKVNRGIVVDATLQTTAAGVYALGDCAEVQGQVLPYVLPIMHSARALAKTLLGEITPLVYPLMPIVVKTPACPLVVLPPKSDTIGQWQTSTIPQGMRAEYIDRDGRLAGFALLGAATAERQQLLKKMTAG